MSTVPTPSRSSRVSKPSASAPVCTSDPRDRVVCITSSTRSSTTPSTRRSPGYADTIYVTLLADGGVRVIDNGRGIPVDPHSSDPTKSTVEVVLTILHAGGKFGGGAYAVSGGLHGVGSSVVNALSTRFDVEVKQKGFVWRHSFADGGVPQQQLEKGEAHRRDRNQHHVLAGRRDLHRDHRLRLRHAAHALPADGVPQQGAPHRTVRRATEASAYEVEVDGPGDAHAARTTCSSTSAVSSTTSST